MDGVKKTKNEQIIVIALVGVFGLVLFNSLRSTGVLGGKPVPKKAPAMAATPQAAPAMDGAPLDSPAMEAAPQASQPVRAASTAPRGAGASAAPEMLYTAGTLRDPLVDLLPRPEPVAAPVTPVAEMAPVEEVIPLPKLSVLGLFWGGQTPQALINGKIYRVGEQVDGATIKDIDRNGVTVEFAGRTEHLEIARRAEENSGPMAAPMAQMTPGTGTENQWR